MLKRFWTWFVTGSPASHQWTPWTVVGEETGFLGAPVVVQSRRCITCGWTQRTAVVQDECLSVAERRELAR